MKIRLLTTADIRKCITMEGAIATLEQAFIDLYDEHIAFPPSIHIPIKKQKASMTLIPVMIKNLHNFGLKFLSSFPKNKKHHQPQKNSCIVLIDSNTGLPQVLFDNRYLRQIRTGALSGLSAKLFAPPLSKTLAIVGTGPQSFKQFEAISSVRPIETVYICSKSMDHAMKLAYEISMKYEINVVDKVSNAVEEADIISTVASSKQPCIFLNDIKPNVHINLIGSIHPQYLELDDEILKNACFCVDLIEDAIRDCAEIKRGIKKNFFTVDDILHIGKCLKHSDQDYTKKLTIFRPMGLAYADIALANYVYENAVKDNIGVVFDFE
jgi:ornithine cyclodeaminase